MSGSIREFSAYPDADFRERADVAVVGSGPTGAVVAYELASRGHDVLLLEEGRRFRPRDFVQDGALSMTRTLREGGLRATLGTVLPTMQAIGLGGGSLVNSAICVRPPQAVFDGWSEHFELERTSRAELDPHFDAVGEFIGVGPTPEDVLGARNLVFKRGCDALGYSSEAMPRNVRECRGSGECFTGCRHGAKQSMDVSYIPAAVEQGLRVMTGARVDRVEAAGQCREICGQAVDPETGVAGAHFRVEAKQIVLAAGCMATPVLLQRSGNLANASGQVGRNLQFHPGVAVAAVFPESLDPRFGATQGYQSLQFVDQGFKMETLWAPAPVLAVRLPGFGQDLLRRFAEIPRSAVFDAIASTHRSLGEVRARRRGLDPSLRWHLHPEDVPLLARALFTLCEIAFAAGAEHVTPGVHGLPDVIHSLDQARSLREGSIRGTDLVIAGNHVFCTTRMHGRAEQGVVDEDGRCNEFDNLYIADTGIFPRCPSVNPMFTAMALARRQALTIANRI